jgi:hypothetical protein
MRMGLMKRGWLKLNLRSQNRFNRKEQRKRWNKLVSRIKVLRKWRRVMEWRRVMDNKNRLGLNKRKS